MNSLMELYTTDINLEFLKMEIIQWKRLIPLSNVDQDTTSLKYLHASPVSFREFRSSCHVVQFRIVPEALSSSTLHVMFYLTLF